MVRVLNVISDSNIGGAGRVLLNYLKYADTSRFETAVCLPEGSLLANPLRAAGADVYELPITPDTSFARCDVPVIKDLIRRVDPDIVHTHGSMSGRIAGRQAHRVVIFTRHSVFPLSRRLKSAPGRLLNKLINERYADRIIAVSPAAKENLTDGGIRPDIIDVIMNGVEPVTRADAETVAALRARYHISDNEFVLGILARIEDYKGHLIILDAVKSLTNDGRHVKLLIAGAGSFEQTVRDRVNALGLDDAVVFLGFVTDVTPVLSMLDIQLNASYGTEATSLSLIEGLSIGLPAVVSDYGGNPYVIDDGETGLLFKSGDSAALTDCLRRLMDEPELLDCLGKNAGQAYTDRFTGEIFADTVESIYLKVLKGDTDEQKRI